MTCIRRSGLLHLSAVACLAVLLTGCATQRVDWCNRVDNYTLDQAIMDFGPPDKSAKLSDGATVAEWLTRRGYSYIYSPFASGFYPYSIYPYYHETFTAPSSFLRLTFSPEGKLKAWRKFSR